MAEGLQGHSNGRSEHFHIRPIFHGASGHVLPFSFAPGLRNAKEDAQNGHPLSASFERAALGCQIVDGLASFDSLIDPIGLTTPKWHVVQDGIVDADLLSRVIANFDKDDLNAMSETFCEIEQSGSREVEIATEALVDTLEVDVVETAKLCEPIMLKVLKRRPELLETFDVKLLTQPDAIDLIGIASSQKAISNMLCRILSSPPSAEASTAVSQHAIIAFGQAIDQSISGELTEEWAEMFKRLVDDILPHGLATLVGGSDRAASGLSLLGFPIYGSPSAAIWSEGLGDAANEDRSWARSTVDAYLLALCLRDGVAQTIPILTKTLPRLRYMAIHDMLSPDARAMLNRRLPSIGDNWDFNKRILNVLRKANRDAIDVRPIVSQLSLIEKELSYVFGDNDEESHSFPLMRCFWPWWFSAVQRAWKQAPATAALGEKNSRSALNGLSDGTQRSSMVLNPVNLI